MMMWECVEVRGRAESLSEDVDFDEEIVALDFSNVLSIFTLWSTMYSPLSTEGGET
jgi:hypothetical protein